MCRECAFDVHCLKTNSNIPILVNYYWGMSLSIHGIYLFSFGFCVFFFVSHFGYYFYWTRPEYDARCETCGERWRRRRRERKRQMRKTWIFITCVSVWDFNAFNDKYQSSAHLSVGRMASIDAPFANRRAHSANSFLWTCSIFKSFRLKI